MLANIKNLPYCNIPTVLTVICAVLQVSEINWLKVELRRVIVEPGKKYLALKWPHEYKTMRQYLLVAGWIPWLFLFGAASPERHTRTILTVRANLYNNARCDLLFYSLRCDPIDPGSAGAEEGSVLRAVENNFL